MNSEEIRKRFLSFFEKRGHSVIPSASLVPENDPSVLFTTAGMQPLTPYLLGEKHPAGSRLVNVQKCVRTQDIDEVGDTTHDTFFEMLGNWSLGDYFKKEAITWSYELLTNKEEGFGLDAKRLYITCFEGDADSPKDTESVEVWKSLGIPEGRIYFMGKEDNWWSPGDNGPCGPDTEMFYDLKPDKNSITTKEEFKKADKEGRIVEIWNDVFMEYEKKDGKVIGKLSQKNVDTGAGLERLAMVLQEKNNIFDTDLFKPVMEEIKNHSTIYDERASRIVADHIRTAVFIVSDGVVPSNTDRGYVLRRLIRRATMEARHLDIGEEFLQKLLKIYMDVYRSVYPDLQDKLQMVQDIVKKESEQFGKTLANAIKKLWTGVFYNESISEKEKMNVEILFHFFTTEGFPPDLTLEEYRRYQEEKKMTPLSHQDRMSYIEDFEKKMAEHQKLSRAGAKQKFAGGLADHSEKTIKLHTAHHLLLAALQKILGDDIRQKGSNITKERLRIDFSHLQKVTPGEIKKIEDLVNEQIKKGLVMERHDMPKDEAVKIGAQMEFGVKYGDTVSVYFIKDKDGNVFSKEFCGGPHAKDTSSMGYFRILKEEASSQGVRRIKAILE